MTNIEIANLALDCCESIDKLKNINQYLADNLEFSGPAPDTLNKGQFVEMMSGILRGVANFRFNRKQAREQGNNLVIIPVQITGTHNATLNLPIQGLKPIQATNKQIKLPQEEIHITIKENRITQIYVPKVPGGGIEGLLQQIGHPLQQQRR